MPWMRATTPLGVARALCDLERARAARIAERPVGADVLRRLGVGLDQHLAADAVRTRDAAEKNAVGLGLGHGTYAAGLASPPSALAAASAAAASRSWRFFFGLAFWDCWCALRASSGRRRRGSATRGRSAARRPTASAWRARRRASRGRRCPWAAADCACRSARCSGRRAARPIGHDDVVVGPLLGASTREADFHGHGCRSFAGCMSNCQ